jgi:murein DD-endopeptidase MepM/ murein hydrolase activator NlpD
MAFSSSKGSRGVRFFYGIVSVVLAVVVTGGWFLFFEGEKPVVNIDNIGDYLGRKGTISYSARDAKSGIRSVNVSYSRGEMKKTIHSATYPRTSYTGAIGPREDAQEIVFDTKVEGVSDGPLLITVEAADFSMRGWFTGNKTTVVKEVTVDTVPPRVQLLHNEKYISPGGTGIALYRLADNDSAHGVSINGQFHPGFPLHESNDGIYICYFALPYDALRIDTLAVSAVDKAGNEMSVPFASVFKDVAQKKDSINIGDGFLQEKIPEFQQHYPEMQGDLVDKYLYVNNNVRERNNAKIAELCRTTQPKRMWHGRFLRMPGSSPAGYADHRTYFYNNQEIDKQVHLGMDIASTQRIEVRAANNGQVVFAEYLGIYGNMVLIDHGQGVFSLYSHLSQINVSPGDNVDQQAVVGLTGTTGMAGGDHLHFSMLVNGVFVTPKEWWDQHWIAVTIEDPIKDLKFNP